MDILNDELLYTENLSKNFQGITAVDKVNFKINKKRRMRSLTPNSKRFTKMRKSKTKC